MPMMCAVSFERYGRLYYFDAGDLRRAVGDKVLVPDRRGPRGRRVRLGAQWVDEPVTPARLVGLATDADLARDERHRALRAEARKVRQEAGPRARPADEAGRPSTTSSSRRADGTTAAAPATPSTSAPPTGSTSGCSSATWPAALSARVELRQVGARDEARVQGGIGPCGRDLCCATFLKDFEPVTIRMAKDQDLPLNPLKISGACGRLMCCLKYEHPLYQEFKADLPAIGVDGRDRRGRRHGWSATTSRPATSSYVCPPRASAAPAARPTSAARARRSTDARHGRVSVLAMALALTASLAACGPGAQRTAAPARTTDAAAATTTAAPTRQPVSRPHAQHRSRGDQAQADHDPVSGGRRDPGHRAERLLRRQGHLVRLQPVRGGRRLHRPHRLPVRRRTGAPRLPPPGRPQDLHRHRPAPRHRVAPHRFAAH